MHDSVWISDVKPSVRLGLGHCRATPAEGFEGCAGWRLTAGADQRPEMGLVGYAVGMNK